MAITITWPTPTNGYVGTVHVPKADTGDDGTTPEGYELRTIDVNWLRGEVSLLWASVVGGPYYEPFVHNGEVTVAGLTLGRVVTFYYRVEFEDGQYDVRTYGANHNIRDVRVGNQVSLTTENSPGLIRADETPAEAIADAVWDEILTGASHNDPTSAGRRLRQSQLSSVIREDVAQGATASTIQFDVGASSLDDFYNHTYVLIVGGTGQGQARTVQTYVGATKTANVVPDWVTTPDNTSDFIIFPFTEVHAHEVHEVDNIADAVLDATALNHDTSGSTGQILNALRRVAFNRLEEKSGTPGTFILYADDDINPYAEMTLLDEDGNAVLPQVGSPARRSKASWPV